MGSLKRDRLAPVVTKAMRIRTRIAEEADSITESIAEIEMALRLARGSVSEAARKIGVSRRALSRKIDSAPSLREILRDIGEEVKDKTEQKLIECIDDGNVTAITFYLKTKGKDRGYSERNTVELEAGSGFNAAGLIDSMRKGIEMRDDDIVDLEEDEWESEETD